MSLQASCRYYSQGTQAVRPIGFRGRAMLQPISPTVMHMAKGGRTGDMDDQDSSASDEDEPSRTSMNVNDMQNMVMGTPIPTSLPIGSLHMMGGGMVPAHPGRPPKTVLAEIPTKGVDQVPALLQGGEIVIPKALAPGVNKMLKARGIKLPGC